MIAVLDSLLRPIARLAMARGVVFAQVADRLKLQFVNGSADLAADAKLTDSRISVMTGLQRRDVVRLRALEDEAPPVTNHLSRLVAAWVRQGGKPLDRKDFDVLANEIRRDVHPRTQLEQLVHAGTVAVEGDLISLLATSYQPLPGSADQLDYLGRNGADYLAAATANVMQDPAPFFERAAHYNGLSSAAIAELDEAFRAGQMALLQEISAKAAALQVSDPGTERFRAGAYFYHTEDA